MDKKYMCVSKCPELDHDGSPHCKMTTNELEKFREYDLNDCPCGNKTKWIEIKKKKKISSNCNPYWANIQKIADKQRNKGIKKYGYGLEDNPILDDEATITYLQEELIDALMYCEHLKAKLREKK